MVRIETRMGGSRETFPETVWSSILSCKDPNDPKVQSRLNELFSTYWRPVYKFVRAAHGKTVEDAKDLTQAFFCHVLEDGVVLKYEPKEGRFRHFLKGTLKNFLAEVHRDSTRLKRGGGKTIVSLDVAKVETHRFQSELGKLTPEEIFDKQWARDVVARSIRRLKEVLAKEGKADHFRVYEAYEIQPEGSPTYESVGQELGMAAQKVKSYLEYARTRLRDVITETVCDYVASRDEMLAELRYILTG